MLIYSNIITIFTVLNFNIMLTLSLQNNILTAINNGYQITALIQLDESIKYRLTSIESIKKEVNKAPFIQSVLTELSKELNELTQFKNNL